MAESVWSWHGLCLSDEITCWTTKTTCEPEQVRVRRVSLAPLDHPDVVRVELCPLTQGLLRQPECEPAHPDGAA